MESKINEGLNTRTTIVILISAGVLLVWSFFSSLLNSGPISASIITYVLYIFYWFYALYFKNPLVIRLLIIGTIAGFLELFADHYMVSTIDSLVYPTNELKIWDSPAYMPFAWSNVILQLSFIGVLLTKKKGLLIASIVLCIAGGMYIPVYEHLAKNAGWWWYNNNVKMILSAPIYVILCEALISLSLPVLLIYARTHQIAKTFLVGIVEGIWIFISAILAFLIAH